MSPTLLDLLGNLFTIALTGWDNNPDKAAAYNARLYKNSTKERVAARRLAFFEAQGFKCAICGKPDSGSKRGWHLDHDHSCCPQPTEYSCGKCDRGVLCHFCNTKVLMILETYGHLVRPALDYLGYGDLQLAQYAAVVDVEKSEDSG